METIIKVDNLRKYYGESRGVEDVTLSILKGEVYGFIGPNGAGKSTTIRTIMGLIDKDSGEIYIKNKKIDRNDINTKKLIGYLPYEPRPGDGQQLRAAGFPGQCPGEGIPVPAGDLHL